MKLEEDEIIMYNSNDIKRIFKCGTKQVYELLHTNGFPKIVIGRKLLVEKKSLEKWIKQNEGKKVITNPY